MRLHRRPKSVLLICLLLPLFLLTQSVASTQAATSASSALPILIERVSIGQDEANGSSREAVISADGRYVAFTTTANNLDPGTLQWRSGRVCTRPDIIRNHASWHSIG